MSRSRLPFFRSLTHRSRSHRLNQGRATRLRLEPLENRQLLTVVQWIGGSGDWNVGTNWSNGVGPGTEDDVVIDVAGDVTVTHVTGEHTVASITANDRFSLTGGVLRVNGIIGGSGPIYFAGGTLENATIAVGATVINSSADSKTLKNATILGTLDMATFASRLSIDGDLTLNGQFLMGHSIGGPGPSQVRTLADTSITGTGSLVFGGNGLNDFGCLGIGLTTEIGAGITVRGAAGKLGSSFCPILNHGTIHADTAGGGLTVHFADTGFASTGTLRVSAGTLTVDGNWAAGNTEITGGTLNLKGDFSTASLGTFSRGANGTAGTVNVLGTLRNGLTLNDTYGSWFLKGGTLLGGVLDVAPGSIAELIGTDFDGTLSGVNIRRGLSLETPFSFGARVLFNNQTTLDQTLWMKSSRLSVDGVLAGAGTIHFGDTTSAVQCGSSLAMTLGPQLTVRGKVGTVGAFNCTLVNQGTIHSDTAEGRLQVNFSNTNIPSPGTLRVSAGTLVVEGNNWQSGATEVLGGTLHLLGAVTQQSLSTVRRGGNGAAGRIILQATLTGGLTLTDDLGSIFLQYAVFVGGILDVAPGHRAQLIATDSPATFSGVNIRGGLNMEVPFVGFGGTSVLFNNQTTLDQTLQLGGANGEGTSRLTIDGTLNGTGTIVFGNVAGNTVSCSGNLVMNIGPDITIRGKQGIVSSFGCNTQIQGTIQAESGGTIHIGSVQNYANGVLSSGTWKALQGSTLRLDGAQITSIAADVVLDGLGSRIIRNIAADSALTNLATIAPGGALVLRHGVNHSTVGGFSNDGNLSIGPGSTLSVNGALTLGAASTLSLEIGGNPSSGQFGRLVTSGNAAIAGALDVRLTDGYGPTSGLTYSSMTFGERTGDFAAKTLTLGDVPMFITSYSSTSLLVSTIANAPNLAVTSVTPPSSVHVGNVIAIPFSATNVSGTAAPGGWHDAVYLSLDDTLGSEDIRLGTVERMASLAGDSTIAGVLTAPIPRMPTGTYRVLVVADDEAMIPDLSRANNVGLSLGTTEVSMAPSNLNRNLLALFCRRKLRWEFGN